MGPTSPSVKSKLTITKCKVSSSGVVSEDEDELPFVASINPSGYKYSSSIEYAKKKIRGGGTEAKFSRMGPRDIAFKELVIDGTGVVGGSSNTSVSKQIEHLKSVAYNYSGSEHQTPIVKVSWGPILFNARLKELLIDYTLFKPNGEPLRAKITLSFIFFRSNQQIFRESSLESPDLTHLVEIKAGDTLPNLCYQIYKDASYYVEVARINRLTSFRRLHPGQVLRFPPLV